MKKFFIIVGCIVVIGVIGTLVYLKVQKDKASEPINTENVDLSLLEFDENSIQAVRLPNSQEMVYIQGITEEHASNLDAAFRMYETTDATVVEADYEFIYTELEPKVMEWFNPEFDLLGAFATAEHDTDGPNAWLENPLTEELAKENNAEIFYFRTREEGGYEMSAGYYLVGYAYSGIGRLVTSEVN